MIQCIRSEADMTRAIRHLKKVDPILGAEIRDNQGYQLKKGMSHFEFLIRAVVFQMLSGKAATTIFGRLKASLDGRTFNYKAFDHVTDKQILSAGLSRAKLKSIRSICRAVESGSLNFRKLARMEDGPAMDYLTAITGIGPWTARIILMFDFGRADLYATGDIGLETAIYHLYGNGSKAASRRSKSRKRSTKKLDIEKISSVWSPYRTVACWYLWRYLHRVRGEEK